MDSYTGVRLIKQSGKKVMTRLLYGRIVANLMKS